MGIPPGKQQSDAASVAWPINQVTIVGVGLLGGSLGLALKSRGLARRVVGLGRSRDRLEAAKSLGCIDSYATEAADALPGSDLVVLCQPVTVILDFLPECFRLIDAGTVVTDVGSTKASIVEAGEKAAATRGENTAFVGSHPMAGSERTGATNADVNLFEGATCHVTVTETTPSRAAARTAALWKKVGMRLVLDHPKRHDRMVATISHVPHLVAVALVESLKAIDGHPQFQSRLSGPGFRDMTRVAMGSPDVWVDICQENREAILEGIGELVEILEQWRSRLTEFNGTEIRTIFEQVRERRLAFLPSTSTESESDDTTP